MKKLNILKSKGGWIGAILLAILGLFSNTTLIPIISSLNLFIMKLLSYLPIYSFCSGEKCMAVGIYGQIIISGILGFIIGYFIEKKFKKR